MTTYIAVLLTLASIMHACTNISFCTSLQACTSLQTFMHACIFILLNNIACMHFHNIGQACIPSMVIKVHPNFVVIVKQNSI
jgi:hypothetical protein